MSAREERASYDRNAGSGQFTHHFRKLFGEFRSRHLPMIEHYVIQNSGSVEDAEDIFQDALIIYFRRSRSKSFQLDCNPGTFLYAVARNLWRKRLRGRTRRTRRERSLEISSFEEPVSIYEELAPGRMLLRTAFRKLPCPCRRILNYFYFHQKKYEDIARIMGISTVQVAKNQKHRCMQRLRKTLIILHKAVEDK